MLSGLMALMTLARFRVNHDKKKTNKTYVALNQLVVKDGGCIVPRFCTQLRFGPVGAFRVEDM